jgi:nucleoid-associated protein YgaU
MARVATSRSAGAAALLAWFGLSWFCLAVSLEVFSQLPGVIGRGCSVTAASVTPRVVRRLAQAAVGLTVLAGPISAPSAWAASAAPNQPATVLTVATVAGPTASPDVSVDRPLGSGPTPELRPPMTGSLASGTDLDRPAGSFVAWQPAPPSLITPTAPAVIVAGVPHREAPREGYVVRRGDTLWDIAARHLSPGASAADIAHEWPRWYAANRTVIGANPNLLRPRELLTPPVQ